MRAPCLHVREQGQLAPSAPVSPPLCLPPPSASYASVFQMLRGTLVIFAGLLTIGLLGRRLHAHHWLGMVLICAGAALVGASSLIYDQTNPQRQAAAAAGLLAPQGGTADGHSDGSGGAGGTLQVLLAALGLGGRSGNASNPLMGNILVVVAQVGVGAVGGEGPMGLRLSPWSVTCTPGAASRLWCCRRWF